MIRWRFLCFLFVSFTCDYSLNRRLSNTILLPTDIVLPNQNKIQVIYKSTVRSGNCIENQSNRPFALREKSDKLLHLRKIMGFVPVQTYKWHLSWKTLNISLIFNTYYWRHRSSLHWNICIDYNNDEQFILNILIDYLTVQDMLKSSQCLRWITLIATISF